MINTEPIKAAVPYWNSIKDATADVKMNLIMLLSSSLAEEHYASTQKTEAHIFDCFDGGGWASDPRDSNEIADELHDSRVSERPSVEPW